MSCSGVRWLRSLVLVVVTAMGLALAVAAPAAAQAPGNDSRWSPAVIGSLPATIPGSLVEATSAYDDPWGCGGSKNSLWYSYTPTESQSILVGFSANGVMDGSVDIYSVTRSQLGLVGCSATDKDGEALVDLTVTAGQEYLIKVSALWNSALDKFTLRVVAPGAPTPPPGEPLPTNGVVSEVYRFTNPDDVWSVDLVAGTTYRMNFVTTGDYCAFVDLFPAGTTSFEKATPLRSKSCDAHTVFVAETSGSYPIRVMAPRWARVRLPYRLAVGPAQANDSAPGVPLFEDTATTATLTGSQLDALDMYRIGVAHRSLVRVQLETKANLTLTLMKPGGEVLGTSTTEIELQLPKGRYYAVVKALDGADGSYAIRWHHRVITSAKTRVNGRASVSVGQGHAVRLVLLVSPKVSGPTTLLVEWLDPIDGWQFAARLHPTVTKGRAVVDYLPPALGSWRVTGSFDGTWHSSPAPGGIASFWVVDPLTLTAL